MKKFKFDKKLVQIAILVFIVIMLSIAFEKFLGNITGVLNNLGHGIGFFLNLLKPFFVGFCIAYLLNPGVRFSERKLLKLVKKKNTARCISIAIVYLIAIIAIAWLITSIIPKVILSTEDFINTLPDNLDSLNSAATDIIITNDVANTLTILLNYFNMETITLDNVMTYILQPLNNVASNIPALLTSVIQSTLSIASFIFQFILGIVISIYMLYDKEYFSSLSTRALYAFTKDDVADKTVHILSLSNTTFERFIVGKAIDSMIIGFLFFIICRLLGAPYATLLSIIIAITNMIPYFGPFIGAVPVLIITAITDISLVIPLGIAILALQQFDGIILGPKILGDSVGLKPMSIIFAILIGGGLFGPIGMFLGAPVFAVCSTMVSGIIDSLEIKKKDNTNKKEVASEDADIGDNIE